MHFFAVFALCGHQNLIFFKKKFCGARTYNFLSWKKIFSKMAYMRAQKCTRISKSTEKEIFFVIFLRCARAKLIFSQKFFFWRAITFFLSQKIFSWKMTHMRAQKWARNPKNDDIRVFFQFTSAARAKWWEFSKKF